MNSEPVRLLLADYTKTFGGAPEHAVSLTKYLSQLRKADVTFLSPQDQLRERVVAGGGHFVKIELPDDRLSKPAKNDILSKGMHFVREWSSEEIPAVRQVVKAARAARSQIIQLNNIPSFQRSGVLASAFLRRPCIATHQAFEQSTRSVRALFPLITKHVAISKAVQDHLHRLGIAPDRVRLIHDAIDSSRFHAGVMPVRFADLFGIPEGAPTFGIVGRLVRWKGHEMFLEAAAHIIREVPDAYGIIIGDVSDGNVAYEKRLKDLAVELGVANRVIFAGRQSNVPGFVKALGVALHLSREPEPLGLVVAEALAVGTPVVGMNEGGVPDMLTDGATGYLCDPKPAEPIAAAVVRLLRDKEQRDRFGERGAREMAERFTAEQCAMKYADLYSELV